MVSPLGLEPRTNALKGRCVAPGHCGGFERRGPDNGTGWGVDGDAGNAGDRMT